jgi:hypothetical protein
MRVPSPDQVIMLPLPNPRPEPRELSSDTVVRRP